MSNVIPSISVSKVSGINTSGERYTLFMSQEELMEYIDSIRHSGAWIAGSAENVIVEK